MREVTASSNSSSSKCSMADAKEYMRNLSLRDLDSYSVAGLSANIDNAYKEKPITSNLVCGNYLKNRLIKATLLVETC